MNIMNLYVYENRSMSNDLSKPLMLENLNVDNVQIHIPKEIDGTDMGTWAWWLVYQNAKREKYSIPMTLEGVTNDEGEEEYISTVGLNHGFTGKHGTVMYAIEAVQADGSGTATHEWHTRTYKLEIVHTLQGNQTEYSETESDIISALISRVNELITSGAEIAEIAETIEHAAETAQEVIDSIPADYSTLSAQVDTNTEDIGGLKADLGALDERVEALESGGGGSGLTDDVKTALMNLVDHLAWDDDDPTGQTYITALSNALYPPANLVSISAVYTQSGTVYDTDTLDSLKPSLVVTANYSDSSTQTVTNYTLSGTLTAGTSTITVTYGGKTTTFSVTVTANPYLAYWDFTQSLVDTVNGYEFTLSCGSRGTLERTSEGLVFSCPDTGGYDASAQLPNGVNFQKGSKLTIEFGASDAQFTKNGGHTSGTTYGLGNGCLMSGVITLYWRGSYDKFYSYGSEWSDKWISTAPDYFNNKTMVVEVASDRTRTVTVDGVLFGTVPGSGISSDKYTFMFGRKTTDGQTFHNIVIKKVYVEALSS